MTGKCSRSYRSQYLWRTLVVTTFVACVALVYVILTFKDESYLRNSVESSIQAEKLTDESCIDVCNTKECLLHAKFLLNNMNQSIDPCDDFYGFACGRYGDRFGKDEYDFFVKRHITEVLAKVDGILDNIEPTPGSAFEKMKIVYDSCRNPGSEVDAVSTALKFLESIGIPDWPNLEANFSFSDSDLTSLLGSLIAHNKEIIVIIKNERLDKALSTLNATMRIRENTYISSPSMQLLVHRMLKYFGLEDESAEEIWNGAISVEDVILNLETVSYSVADGNETYISVDCSQADETEWKFACKILNDYLDTVAISQTVKRTAFISAYQEHFMKKLIPTFRNVSSKSIAHYVALSFLLEHMKDLNFYFRLENPTNNTPRTNRKPITEHEYCTRWIMNNLVHALAYEYILKVISEPALQEVQDIVGETIKESNNFIYNQDWISDDFKEKMINKLSNISTTIDKLKRNLNETFINCYYEEFHPTEENFFLNVLRYGKYAKRRILSGIMKDEDVEYFNPLFAVNAEAADTEIDIGLGLLLPTLFSYGLHKSINLISFGQLMAHEIAHEVQIGYESLFRVHNITLHDNSTLQKFLEKRSCFRNQFSNFKYDLVDVEPNTYRTVDEDMADGLSTIFIDEIIEKYGSGIEFLLPSLPYSKVKLLYISSIQMYCENMTKKVQEFYSKEGYHSISRFRVLAIMQNSKGFAKAFNCSTGTYMNPANKCFLFD